MRHVPSELLLHVFSHLPQLQFEMNQQSRFSLTSKRPTVEECSTLTSFGSVMLVCNYWYDCSSNDIMWREALSHLLHATKSQYPTIYERYRTHSTSGCRLLYIDLKREIHNAKSTLLNQVHTKLLKEFIPKNPALASVNNSKPIVEPALTLEDALRNMIQFDISEPVSSRKRSRSNDQDNLMDFMKYSWIASITMIWLIGTLAQIFSSKSALIHILLPIFLLLFIYLPFQIITIYRVMIRTVPAKPVTLNSSNDEEDRRSDVKPLIESDDSQSEPTFHTLMLTQLISILLFCSSGLMSFAILSYLKLTHISSITWTVVFCPISLHTVLLTIVSVVNISIWSDIKQKHNHDRCFKACETYWSYILTSLLLSLAVYLADMAIVSYKNNYLFTGFIALCQIITLIGIWMYRLKHIHWKLYFVKVLRDVRSKKSNKPASQYFDLISRTHQSGSLRKFWLRHSSAICLVIWLCASTIRSVLINFTSQGNLYYSTIPWLTWYAFLMNVLLVKVQ